MLNNEPVQSKLGTRLSMLEEIDRYNRFYSISQDLRGGLTYFWIKHRLKEEITTLQEEKENAEEKMHSQSLKIRRLVEEKMSLQRGKDGGAVSPSLVRSESTGSIESEDGGILVYKSKYIG